MGSVSRHNGLYFFFFDIWGVLALATKVQALSSEVYWFSCLRQVAQNV